jgi:L-lysine 6-transaminase
MRYLAVLPQNGVHVSINAREVPMSVINRLKDHILVDGFHVVVDLKKSHGSWIVDRETGKEYLDCYSQFASQPLGWNHPGMEKHLDKVREVAAYKLANSDMYCEEFAEFVEVFAGIVPDFRHKFFIDGGALAVENALKAAFDWKAKRLGYDESKVDRLEVCHLRQSFHGRSGYTLSLTNTDSNKTDLFPKFRNWTKLHNPSIHYHDQTNQDFWHGSYIDIEAAEDITHRQLVRQLQNNHVAAVIIETIQGEGGDHHFRQEFYNNLRWACNNYEAMLIFDEVQTGLGLTGKMWAYQHFNVVPDMMCFGKKTQVCGFASTEKIDTVPDNVFRTSGRINSTWGGNLVDMVRATGIIRVIEDESLVQNAADVGGYLIEKLKELQGSQINHVRGRGLMVAFDCKDTESRNRLYDRLHDNMLALKSGSRAIRFRPALTFSKQDADRAVEFIKAALD